MPYELTVTANRKDPEDRGGRAPRQVPTVSTLLLTGTLDAQASDAVLAMVATAHGDGVNSTVVEFGDVAIDDRPALDALLRGLMALRENGIEVQIFARSDALHDRLMPLADSRDWLLWRPVDGSGHPRKSLHLDGPRS